MVGPNSQLCDSGCEYRVQDNLTLVRLWYGVWSADNPTITRRHITTLNLEGTDAEVAIS